MQYDWKQPFLALLTLPFLFGVGMFLKHISAHLSTEDITVTTSEEQP